MKKELFEMAKKTAIARLHQAISDSLDDVTFDDFLNDYYEGFIDLESFEQYSDKDKIKKIVDFFKSELAILEDAIWDIIKEETEQ